MDYGDFSEQVSKRTQSFSVLEFADHGAVLREGFSISEAVKSTKDVATSSSPHFTCVVLEELLMRVEAEEAEAEGAPRLMPTLLAG